MSWTAAVFKAGDSVILGQLTIAKGPESHTEDVGKHWKYPDLQVVALDAKRSGNEKQDVHESSYNRNGGCGVEEHPTVILGKVLRRQRHELFNSGDLHDGVSEMPLVAVDGAC
jgi:hypothetical protein